MTKPGSFVTMDDAAQQPHAAGWYMQVLCMPACGQIFSCGAQPWCNLLFVLPCFQRFSQTDKAWEDQYFFSTAQSLPPDFAVMNFAIAADPSSLMYHVCVPECLCLFLLPYFIFHVLHIILSAGIQLTGCCNIAAKYGLRDFWLRRH